MRPQDVGRHQTSPKLTCLARDVYGPLPAPPCRQQQNFSRACSSTRGRRRRQCSLRHLAAMIEAGLEAGRAKSWKMMPLLAKTTAFRMPTDFEALVAHPQSFGLHRARLPRAETTNSVTTKGTAFDTQTGEQTSPNITFGVENRKAREASRRTNITDYDVSGNEGDQFSIKKCMPEEPPESPASLATPGSRDEEVVHRSRAKVASNDSSGTV